MGEVCGRRRARRRLFVTTGVVAFAAAGFAESALAQLPSAGQPVAQITEPLAGLTQPVAQPIAQVTAPVAEATVPVTQVVQPVTQTAEPVVQQAAPVIQQTAEPVTASVQPVTQAAAPVLQAAQPVTEVAAPVLEAAQPLVEVAAPVLELAQPVVDATTAPLQQLTSPLLETTSPLLELTAPVVGSSVPRVEMPPVADVAAESATAQPTSTGATSFVAATNDPAGRAPAPAYGDAHSHPGRAVRDPASVLRQSLVGSSLTPRMVAAADGHKASAAKLATPRPDDPSAPRGPLGLLVEISATFGSSALLLLVAALAALFLAAPALGRWLRLRLARWPLPIPLPSLERPG